MTIARYIYIVCIEVFGCSKSPEHRKRRRGNNVVVAALVVALLLLEEEEEYNNNNRETKEERELGCTISRSGQFISSTLPLFFVHMRFGEISVDSCCLLLIYFLRVLGLVTALSSITSRSALAGDRRRDQTDQWKFRE